MMARIEANMAKSPRIRIKRPSKNQKHLVRARKMRFSGMIPLITGLTTSSSSLIIKKFASITPVPIEVSNAIRGQRIKANIDPTTLPEVDSAVAILHAIPQDRPKR